MLTINNPLNKVIDVKKYLGLNPEECIFFDIETTGFSASNSQLYLIGVVYYEKKQWLAIQWFADTFLSEEDVLKNFFDFIAPYSYLINFNGDGFDIPYLSKKALMFGIHNSLEDKRSVDIYKAVKCFKTLLNLENHKQKSIEKFLEISREDRYNGGELIEVYQQYLRDQSSERLHLLLLHNAEDIAGMPDILPIMAYGRLTDTSYCGINVANLELISFQCDEKQEEFVAELQSDILFPKDLKLSTRTKLLQLKNRTVTFHIRMHFGKLRHFFSNYKDYFYLPAEDTAIHKSVAQFVDKEFREKAKASNCYVYADGFFLPQYSGDFEPVFTKEYRDKELFFKCDESFLSDRDAVKKYLFEILCEFVK